MMSVSPSMLAIRAPHLTPGRSLSRLHVSVSTLHHNRDQLKHNFYKIDQTDL